MRKSQFVENLSVTPLLLLTVSRRSYLPAYALLFGATVSMKIEAS